MSESVKNESIKEEVAKQRRICRKCLTAEMDEAAYFENLRTYIANLDKDVKVSRIVYEERLALCKSCDLLADGMCRACGCFVELRAVMWKNACPYDKWTSQQPENTESF